jgi:D-alanine-D-alanine ligase
MKACLRDKKIGVLLGGLSMERAVSLRSGEGVYQALCDLGYQVQKIDPIKDDVLEAKIDIAFIALHGRFGEDGTIQSYLEHHKIAYTGSRIKASVIGMNKLLTKEVLKKQGLANPDFKLIYEEQSFLPKGFELPVIIKPVDQGSSVDVFYVDSFELWQKEQKNLLKKYGVYILEKYIKGKEITVGVLEREGAKLQALPILELRPKNTFYDYEAKYTEGMTQFILPAELSDSETKTAQALAKQVHQKIGCRGFSRIDMIFHKEEGPFVLEVNTIPGMTNLSDLPAQAKQAGISYNELVEIILKSAI